MMFILPCCSLAQNLILEVVSYRCDVFQHILMQSLCRCYIIEQKFLRTPAPNTIYSAASAIFSASPRQVVVLDSFIIKMDLLQSFCDSPGNMEKVVIVTFPFSNMLLHACQVQQSAQGSDDSNPESKMNPTFPYRQKDH